jgi:serine/threonine protein kinase
MSTLRIEPGSEPIPGYKLIDRLGGGGFGEVWKAEAPGGLLKAIKIVYGDLQQTDADGTKRAEQELKALKRVQSVRHPYLLSLERYDIVENRLLIVMELADRNLWDRYRECRAQNLPGIPRDELLRYMEEAAEVLDLMNGEYQLQHLDIKPQNLFLVRNHVKVADFGLVKDLEGMMATVTGGITPVYAAPETFDGKVSRFCDQYSLAIVYQELLTGQRPFSGTSLQQLIMQHLSSPPNLSPLPKVDRAPIARSLNKKPEGRFPSCTDLVEALRVAGEAARPASSTLESPLERTPSRAEPGTAPETPTVDLSPAPRFDTPSGLPAVEETGPPVQDLAPVREAPPKQTGDGVLFPSLVIGLGQQGIEALQTLREGLCERFGSLSALPHIRLLAIDTDPDAMSVACRSVGNAALSVTETLPVRLNRPSHYLRAAGGKTLLDGWFNPKLIYRIPRTPVTTGLRCLGRLALVDHYRAIVGKLRVDLEDCTQPEALAAANRHTKLGLRCNYPRVYVIAGLTGGTGSGMFIDLAYIVRAQLHQLGYTDPDVIGILLLPAAGVQRGASTLALGNAFAAMTELNYFNAATTTFSFRFDDKEGKIKDKDAPFRRSIVLPLEPEADKKRTGETARLVGDLLLRDLTAPLGRLVETCRPADTPEAPAREKSNCHTLGSYRFSWPRRILLHRSSRQVCAQLLDRWMEKDAAPVRQAVHAWLEKELARLEIDTEVLIGILQDACEKELGHAPESAFADLIEPFIPKAKRGPDPDPEAVREAAGQLEQLVGSAQAAETPGQGEPAFLEAVMEKTGEVTARKWGSRLVQLAASLVENPDFRLRGAEEALRRLTAIVEEAIETHDPIRQDLEHEAEEAQARIYEALQIIEENPGGGRRTAAVVADLVEALRDYPRARYQSLLLRHVDAIYVGIRGKLSDQVRELTFCRQRVNDLLKAFNDPTDTGPPCPPPAPGRLLLPAGTESLDEAIEAIVGDISVEDLRNFDKTVQETIGQQFGSLVQVCLNSSNIVKSLEDAMQRLGEAFVARRLTGTNVVEMFLAHYADEETAGRHIAEAYEKAVPELARKVTCNEPEIRIMAMPPGAAADKFRGLVRKALTNLQLAFADSPDDIVVYREQPGLAIEKLELLGPVGQNAYAQMTKSDNFSAHSREDITDWQAGATES